MPIHITRGNYYTVGEASEYLNVTEGYICRLLSDGRLTGIRIGKLSWLIPAEQIRERKKNPPPMGRPKS